MTNPKRAEIEKLPLKLHRAASDFGICFGMDNATEKDKQARDAALKECEEAITHLLTSIDALREALTTARDRLEMGDGIESYGDIIKALAQTDHLGKR